jgi:predicted ATP-dependent endonuclease of OLD family
MDEPDVHMHPALVRDFVRILKQLSKQTQFFITTHNIAFIDALAPEDLFTVVYRPEEKGSIIRSVTERDEVIEAAEMLGISVTNSILSGKPKVYVFVEGESDSAYLLHFAKRLGYAKSVNAFNVQFVPMGGKGTRFNMLRLIEKLGMNETPVVMVLDHDETSEEEIQTLREKHFNKYPERLVYWSRRQIENYICMPSAIQKLLQAPPQANKYASEIQGLNIEALVQELADKQLEAALKRFLEHTVINYSLVRTQEIRNILKDLDISLPSDEYSQELASKMFAMMSKQFMKLGQHSTSIKTTFLEQWSIHEKRLAMCDGRQLLSDMRKEFQERGLYSSFSNDEIIAFCNSEDIHADIRELLSQLHIMVTTF